MAEVETTDSLHARLFGDDSDDDDDYNPATGDNDADEVPIQRVQQILSTRAPKAPKRKRLEKSSSKRSKGDAGAGPSSAAAADDEDDPDNDSGSGEEAVEEGGKHDLEGKLKRKRGGGVIIPRDQMNEQIRVRADPSPPPSPPLPLALSPLACRPPRRGTRALCSHRGRAFRGGRSFRTAWTTRARWTTTRSRRGSPPWPRWP